MHKQSKAKKNPHLVKVDRRDGRSRGPEDPVGTTAVAVDVRARQRQRLRRALGRAVRRRQEDGPVF